MDKFTAQVLVSTLKETKDSETVSTLYRMLSRNEGGPTRDAERWFNDHKDKFVSVLHTSHVGIVTELNTTSSGIYCGGRYPIYVKIIKSNMEDAVGKVFEYGVEQLRVMEDV